MYYMHSKKNKNSDIAFDRSVENKSKTSGLHKTEARKDRNALGHSDAFH